MKITENSKKFSEEEITQRKELIAKAKQTIAEEYPRWKDDPNVVGIGYGLRSRKGQMTQEIVLSFMVRTKEKDLSKIEALESKIIPATINGIPTDVIEVGKIRREEATGQRDEEAYNPLVGGCATSNADSHILFWNSFGTLGSICFDKETGAPMALSNWHVWADGGEEGDAIIQPGHPRTEDRIQAYFEVGFCGPIANLIEWQAPSALTTGLAAGAAAAALAAAASDVIDPSRKGQENTMPSAGPGELTLKETVDMKIQYLTQPLPGTPFQLKTSWDYKRFTNKKTYNFALEEDIKNQHVLVSKYLRTNKRQYRPGEEVELYATLIGETPLNCDYYYVVAYLIPVADEGRMTPVILHPVACGSEKTCIDFSNDKPGDTLPKEFTRLGAEFVSPQPFRIVDIYQHDKKGELAINTEDMVVFPSSSEVEAHIVMSAAPVTMRAFSKGVEVGKVSTSMQPNIVHVLRMEGQNLDRVMFTGCTPDTSMLMFCYTPAIPVASVEKAKLLTSQTSVIPSSAQIATYRKTCCFRGRVTLDPREKPGCWNAYLFVQTTNMVPEGTAPEKAAQVIGGLPVSQNMEDAKNVDGSSNECGACAVIDFMFEVI